MNRTGNASSLIGEEYFELESSRKVPIERRPRVGSTTASGFGFVVNSAAVLSLMLVLIAGVLAPTSATAAAKVRAYTGQLELPTYPWAAVKHPYFRGTDGVNIYPYPMLDSLSREKTNRTYRTVVLENEYLRITFLPELGGKIYDVLDKTVGKPMFYVNHVVKPGLIAQCGAWTSGGVEWNTGPQGHTVSCMQPIPVLILPPEKDGSQSVAVGETERIYGTRWTVVVTLRPGRSFIEERIRIYNPTETVRPYYFWNCTAAPNTPGFRFIYPMTLGCDHAGEKFFKWPIDDGKDLTRGTNYQDASSIFAWHCDQDFFGSYNDDLDHGAVSYANHYQLPGKKAWTWGYGGFGTMHQKDLTDDDGPYNEVQTGPLLTQAQVGRLDPCEAVEWNEFWYPVHGTEGFTFANRELAVNVTRAQGTVRLKVLGTGTWSDAKVRVLKETRELANAKCKLSPTTPADLQLAVSGQDTPLQVEILSPNGLLASFSLPLQLPLRTPPEKKTIRPETASEHVEAGWEHFLFARYTEAEKQFRSALEKDTKDSEAHIGLAYLDLDRDPAAAAKEARAALSVNAEDGTANYVLAVAEARLGHDREALGSAWKAALEPKVAIAARGLAAKILLRGQNYPAAVAALSEPGPWREDPVCLARLGLAALNAQRGSARKKDGSIGENIVASATQRCLSTDPLDWLARDIRNRAGIHGLRSESAVVLSGAAHQQFLDLATQYAQLGGEGCPIEKLDEFPSQPALEPVLRSALKTNAQDGRAALYLGHLLFHLGRHVEGRELWKRAADLGYEPVVAYRALGMAAKTLDADLSSAREWLQKAGQADGRDAIVARDLAKVLFELADKAGGDTEKRQLLQEGRDRLKSAFQQGKGRSDFVALLARAENRLGDYAEAAEMLDKVRVTVWEGSHEVHDLFEQAHLALGEARLKEGRAGDALAEFDRALEYPANLATGKLKNTREAHIQYQRGLALNALGRKQEAVAAWKLAINEPESKDSRQKEAQKKAREALKEK